MTLEAKLKSELSAEDYSKVTSLSHATAEKAHAKAKLNHIQKLRKLIDSRDKHRELRPEGLDKWVINLADQRLTKQQQGVLKLGLNYTPAPAKLPVMDIMVAVEEGARQLDDEDAEDLRGRVCGILRHVRKPKDNLTKGQREALKELRGMKDKVFLPADKGNATVVMRKEDYKAKMRELIESTTYR